jgi:serine/threonine protein kinase
VEPVKFGDYTLLHRVAAGGMGEVLLARQTFAEGVERYVAIKRVLPELSNRDDFVDMFLDEARLAAQLRHSNIVQILDVGLCGDQYYLAMEFLEGRTLRHIMARLARRQRAMPEAFAVKIIHEAAEGLHYAHEIEDAKGEPLNVIHRDVSPQNIFVTFQGTTKLLDFGIAKAEARVAHTTTGTVKGKCAYMPPEQVQGRPVDRRADVFSLGIVLWEVTTGSRLFRRDNDLLTLSAVAACDVPPPSSIAEGYPEELEAIVMRALAREPEQRYPTCSDLQEDLEQFMSSQGHIVTPRRIGAWVQELFDDQPQTVAALLAQLSEEPRAVSLLEPPAVDPHASMAETEEQPEPSTLRLADEDVEIVEETTRREERPQPGDAAPGAPGGRAAAVDQSWVGESSAPASDQRTPLAVTKSSGGTTTAGRIASGIRRRPVLSLAVVLASLVLGGSVAVAVMARGAAEAVERTPRQPAAATGRAPPPREEALALRAADGGGESGVDEPGDPAPDALPAPRGGLVDVQLTTAPPDLLVFVRLRLKAPSQGIDYHTSIAVEPGGPTKRQISVPRGALSLSVEPYAQVSVDGRRLGLTPMSPVQLYAGSHRVVLRNPVRKKTVSRTVVVRPGRQVTLSVDMTEGR